jgi:Regulator of chromosome condensation (RCC1) repeat
MTHVRRHLVPSLLALVLLAAGTATATPAVAATVGVHAVATPATARVGSVVVVSGVVLPHQARTVTVQRLVGRAWKPLAHSRSTKAGAFSVRLRAPAKPATWVLRVVGAKASATLHVHLVKIAFTVRVAAPAPVANTSPVVVTWSVSPKAGGTVWLQQLRGKVWHDVTSTKLTHAATFVLRHAEPAGSYRLRVVKAFSATVAAGASKGVTVVVAPVPVVVTTPGGPTITTASLPSGTAELPYSATLTATGGAGPYSWSATGLPTGLSLSATGVLSGVPAAPSTSSVTVTVSGGGQATVVLSLAVVLSPSAGNTVWGWGDNQLGQLGTGLTNTGLHPVEAVGLTGVTAITGGGYALRFDGTVWAWGNNEEGELGDGTTTTSYVPQRVPGLSSVIAVAGAGNTGYALKSDGTVWAWGQGNNGEIGNGTIDYSLVPAQATGITTATAIASFSSTAYALLADGTVQAWGSEEDAGTGNGAFNGSVSPGPIPGLTHALAVAGGYGSGFALIGP